MAESFTRRKVAGWGVSIEAGGESFRPGFQFKDGHDKLRHHDWLLNVKQDFHAAWLMRIEMDKTNDC